MYNVRMKKITREEIVQTACALFQQKGFDAVSLDEVCRECGISKPTFYNYIPSKEAILTDYYDRVCQDIMLHFGSIYQMNTYYEQFCLFYDMIIDSSIQLGAALISKMLSLNLQKDAHSFETREHLTEIVIHLIEKGQRAGEFTADVSATDLYDAVNFVFLGLELKWAVKQGQIDWKGEFHRITDGLLQVRGKEARHGTDL